MRRRRWLKIVLGGSGLALAGGALGLWRLRGGAPHVDGLRCLSGHEYRTMRALADTIVPRGGAFPPGADDFDVARRFDDFLADAPEEDARDLKRALLLVEYGPLLYDGRLRTFSNLGPAERRAHWDRWELADDVTRRQVAAVFRKFVNLVFYDCAAVWPYIGLRRDAGDG